MRFGFLGRLVKNLGRSPQWPAVRAAHLKKEPSCQACGVTDHLEVHHIAPFHVSPAREARARLPLRLWTLPRLESLEPGRARLGGALPGGAECRAMNKEGKE